ncbi:MAG: flagellar hook-basal body complex protein FliE [Deltaproteobacteria bacterium]|nr:flagellar hook-basal body complex protein FliE [Deltaproteobacteria bacterium]
MQPTVRLPSALVPTAIEPRRPLATTEPVADFSLALSRAGAALVDSQATAAAAVDGFAAGLQGNLHETLLAVDKADISLKLLVTVRNRLLDAYRELMRMGA